MVIVVIINDGCQSYDGVVDGGDDDDGGIIVLDSGDDGNGSYGGSYNGTKRNYCTLATVISTLPELAHSDLKIFCVAVAWQLF